MSAWTTIRLEVLMFWAYCIARFGLLVPWLAPRVVPHLGRVLKRAAILAHGERKARWLGLTEDE